MSTNASFSPLPCPPHQVPIKCHTRRGGEGGGGTQGGKKGGGGGSQFTEVQFEWEKSANLENFTHGLVSPTNSSSRPRECQAPLLRRELLQRPKPARKRVTTCQNSHKSSFKKPFFSLFCLVAAPGAGTARRLLLQSWERRRGHVSNF